jgi:hypothetical protein
VRFADTTQTRNPASSGQAAALSETIKDVRVINI